MSPCVRKKLFGTYIRGWFPERSKEPQQGRGGSLTLETTTKHELIG
jgi:hypothetical protein